MIIDKIFSPKVFDLFLPFTNAENIIHRLHPNCPKGLKNSTIRKLEGCYKIFLNNKQIHSSVKDLEDYKVLKEIYTTIIGR